MSGTKQPTDEIINDLVRGNRHPIDDADLISAHDGLDSIELTHSSNEGSVVVLVYELVNQLRRDPGNPMNEFDICNAVKVEERDER